MTSNDANTAAGLAVGREKTLGHLAMVSFATLIAGSFTLGAMAVPFLEPAALNSLRFFLATCIIGALCLTIGPRSISLPKSPWRFAVLGLPLAVYFITMFVALKTTSPVSTGAVFTLGPFMAAGFGYLLLKQVSKPVVLLSLLIAGLGSVWVIFRGDINAILGFEIGYGETVYFLGCVGHALYAPLVKRLNRGEHLLLFSFWTLAATTGWISLYGISEILSASWSALPPIVWLSIAYLSIFTTAGTTYLVQYASMRLPASKVLSYVYLTPVIVILLEGLAGHGWASWSVLAGAIIIVMGLVVLAFAPDG